MKENELLTVFKERGALLEGHFRLTSGLHSNRYIQCAKVLMYPDLAAELCTKIAAHFKGLDVDLVVGPAIGGIIVAQEVGRALGVKAMFTEREQGKMTLRRGFEIKAGERVVVVEDVVTTGGSTREVIELVKAHGGVLIGVASLVDRHSGDLDFGVPYYSLLKLQIDTYDPADCPLCRDGLPVVKPGSRS
ncbi:MAG: orotate phosphoribosyltransferase [Thermacetogenium sp.]|jgi:orotate phosphoribosyltransferase|nr:orotate phosphoribosyltransferase [Thermacetogenium sp.]